MPSNWMIAYKILSEEFAEFDSLTVPAQGLVVGALAGAKVMSEELTEIRARGGVVAYARDLVDMHDAWGVEK